MDSIRKNRQAHEALAARPTGVPARFARVWPGPIKQGGNELDMVQLPVDAGSFTELQDPTTGQLYFMVGISLVDGDDLVQ